MPEIFEQMRAAWERYAREDGVLPMPSGYEPRRQVVINAFFNVVWPASWPWLLGIGLSIGLALLWRRQRKRVSEAPRKEDTTRSS